MSPRLRTGRLGRLGEVAHKPVAEHGYNHDAADDDGGDYEDDDYTDDDDEG